MTRSHQMKILRYDWKRRNIFFTSNEGEIRTTILDSKQMSTKWDGILHGVTPLNKHLQITVILLLIWEKLSWKLR